MGITTVDAAQPIFKKRKTADQCFIIVTGRVGLYDNPGVKGAVPAVRGPGSFIGDECLKTQNVVKYEQDAIAQETVVLATFSKANYFRICHTEDVQKVIDKFWCLGLAAGKHSEPSLLDWNGYKLVYLRLGKVIATKKMFSQKELRESMKKDWISDLKLFGDPDLGALTHGQYTDSMYQFIDEWSNAVESTQLYEDLLQLILENISYVDKKTGELRLRQLPKIQCW